MHIVIIGANSAIAKATARLYAKETNQFFLVSRNEKELQKVGDDLKARGASKVNLKTVDFSSNTECTSVIEEAAQALGNIDLIVIAHSILGNQEDCQNDYNALMAMYQINTLSSLTLLTLIANLMEKQGNGNIVFISSVAGDRGRPSNYAYGSSKAAVTVFLQGLRARMAKVGVHVMTVKPGFVITPMTEGFPTDGPLWVPPETVAEGIKKGLEKKRNTLYLPWFWFPIMSIIKAIPECIFKRLKL